MTIVTRYLPVFCLLLMLISGCRPKTGLPDLRERYHYKDTKPFGAYTAYHLLGQLYPNKFINITNKSFNDFYADT